jgi:hypothetical protein
MASERSSVSESTDRTGYPPSRAGGAVLTTPLTTEQVAEHLSLEGLDSPGEEHSR